MRTFDCQCGAVLFFHNTLCLTCGKAVGFCPTCCQMTALIKDEDQFRCSHTDCSSRLIVCRNSGPEGVCNWCVAADDDPVDLCISCQLTRVIPDLSLPGNKRRWGDLEQAKRRMLYTLDLLGLPYCDNDGALPLRFEFKGDPVDSQNWRLVSGGEQVMTGHADGVITINIQEADSIQRERARVQFGETLRTVIGHFRHETGHYYWQRLVDGQCVNAFVDVFGDHRSPPYDQAQQQYYANGPQPDWKSRYVSAYASMHPWEDFAETFATYLDMAAVLDTAANAQLIPSINLSGDLESLVNRYRQLGIGVNEINREMGLLDPAPLVMSTGVISKLTFIHNLISGNV